MIKKLIICVSICLIFLSSLSTPAFAQQTDTPYNFQTEFSANGQNSGVCHTNSKYGRHLYITFDPISSLTAGGIISRAPIFVLNQSLNPPTVEKAKDIYGDLIGSYLTFNQLPTTILHAFNLSIFANKNIEFIDVTDKTSKAVIKNLAENQEYTIVYSVDGRNWLEIAWGVTPPPIATATFTCLPTTPVKNITSTACYVDDKGKPLAYLEWEQNPSVTSYDVEVYDQNGTKLDSITVYTEEKDGKTIYKAKVANLAYGINYRPWVRAKNDQTNKMSTWEKGADFSCTQTEETITPPVEETEEGESQNPSVCQVLDKTCAGQGLKKITYTSPACNPDIIPDPLCTDIPASCDLATPNNLQPNNTILSPVSQTNKETKINLTWNQVTNADWYDVRVIETDRLGNPALPVSATSLQPNNCSTGASTADICINRYKGTNLNITVKQGKSYSWWIHANKESCDLTPPEAAFFQVGHPTTTTALCDEKKVTLTASTAQLTPGTRTTFGVTSADNKEGLNATREEFSVGKLAPNSCTGQAKDKTLVCTVSQNASGILTWKHFWNCTDDSCTSGCMKSQDFIINSRAAIPTPTCAPTINKEENINTTQLKPFNPPGTNPC